MAENEGGAGTGTGEGGGASGGGAGAAALNGDGGGTAGDAGGGGHAAPDWMGTLPDDLKGDSILSRYPTVEAAARGLIENRKVASSKLLVPKNDAPPEAWDTVWDAIGRPKDPKDYEIPVPEGDAGTLAEAFRPAAHKFGLNPWQAKGLAEFHTEQMTGAMNAFYAKGDEEITALKNELGSDYEPKKEAAKAIYAKLGFPPEFADELDVKVGSGALLKGFMHLAELTGEHGRADGGSPLDLNGHGDADAESKLKELQRDSEWRKKLEAGDALVIRQRDRLLEAAKAQAVAQKGIPR